MDQSSRQANTEWNFTPHDPLQQQHVVACSQKQSLQNGKHGEDLIQNSLTKPAKCDAAECICNNQAQWSLCHAKNCRKLVHHECYDWLLNCHNVAALIDLLTSNTLLVCSKTCYNRVNKMFSQQPTSRISWDKDRQEGPDDSNHSLQILLDWLLKEGNYQKFHGGTKTKCMRKIDYGKSLSL